MRSSLGLALILFVAACKPDAPAVAAIDAATTQEEPRADAAIDASSIDAGDGSDAASDAAPGAAMDASVDAGHPTGCARCTGKDEFCLVVHASGGRLPSHTSVTTRCETFAHSDCDSRSCDCFNRNGETCSARDGRVRVEAWLSMP